MTDLMLDEFWSNTFGTALPIAHQLRDLYRDRWVRFHSLPQSKRYADTDAEWGTLLDRHNAVLNRMARNGTCLQLLTSVWTASMQPEKPAAAFCELQWPAQHWRTVAVHEVDEDPDPNFLQVYSTAVDWVPGVLDSAIRLVADDRITNVMIVDPADCWLLHPYDGGMDVIARSTDERELLSSAFSDWRSRRSDGL